MTLEPKTSLPSNCTFLTGPTCSGKSDLAVEVAERLGAEIISMDSMALYRRMDIGTAKPPPDHCRRIPHHLVGVVEPWQEFSLAEYLRAATSAAVQVLAREKVPLFVGGTPLYLKALLRGADCGPPPDPELRKRLTHEASVHGSRSLYDRLLSLDPTAGRRIHPNDVRRIVRALEVFEKTSTPISARQIHFNASENPVARVICLQRDRKDLHERINHRVRRMFQAGLVEEVRCLLDMAHPLSRTARQAVGYKEVIEYLQGRRTLDETMELVGRRSRQFAKRQLTWFRHLDECRWVPAAPAEDTNSIVSKIMLELNSPQTNLPAAN